MNDLAPPAEAVPARSTTCPACAFHVAVPFLHGGDQPLATLGWPDSAEAARDMPRLPLDFVRCVDCGHVYNAALDYEQVPYSAKPNRMFNDCIAWSDFLRLTRDRIMARLPGSPTVVEIGHGDGSFLAALAQAKPGGRFVGFDPNGASRGSRAVELRAALFEPRRHMRELRPDLLICRHVLEHLSSPLAFLQDLSFAAAYLGIRPSAYLEVPCIDRALACGRTVDFYYEHGSQFTSESFGRMLSRCAVVTEEAGQGYDGEVVYALVRLGQEPAQARHAREARQFQAAAVEGQATIRRQLAELHASGVRVVIWGGTGKSAAFINRHGVDAERFPLVVDSDRGKVGSFVPGTGQEIRARDVLVERPAAVIVIPPQWRARDILAEIEACGIPYERVLIEHEGRLIDWFADAHPYRAAQGDQSVEAA